MNQEIQQPTIETERLTLSPVLISDLPHIFEYASDPEVARHVTWPPHKDLEDSRKLLEWIEKTHNTTRGAIFFVWAIRLKSAGNKMIGTIDFKQPVSHIGRFDYAMGKSYWNKGLMSEAAQAVKNWSFSELPELVRFEARAIAENTGSRKVMEKTGLQYEGTFRKQLNNKGTLVDIVCYAEIR
ncbi:GNAT family N-acetyltransferase [Bdellovibrio sp. HCB209]|uniref:GNAT family N-acetyltransferase n=1 Tax=Bdellovibrio sp. HCB209 TaxID=3394354 RepID=UPI0039B66B78